MENNKLRQITKECALCGLVTEAAIVVCPADGSALITRRPDPFVGKTLDGQFEILSLIGSGGMGNVYKAHQKAIGRIVAVKILHSEKLQQNSHVLRFQQEARAVAALSHPNIVGFFHFGLTEDNVPYIAMDYIEGVPLSEVLKEQPLSVERFIPLFMQVCDALEHAHEKGIIHRDIKPSNLMLVQTAGDQEQIKILDFGVAKLLTQESSDRAVLTQTGELFGSPQYMSPEQFDGRTLDPRSDIYSLGCVMYEAVTGTPPFRAESLIQLVQKHTTDRPVPIRNAHPDVPQQLEAVILKTLEKDKDLRFPSMAALKHNLSFVHRFADDEPIASTVGSSVNENRLPHSRLLINTAIGITLLLVTVLGGIYSINGTGDISPGRAVLRLQLNINKTLEPTNLKRALAITEQLRDSCARDGLEVQALSYAEQAVQLAETIDEKSILVAQQHKRMAELKELFGDTDAISRFHHALQKLQQVAAQNREDGKYRDNLLPHNPIDVSILELEKKLSGDGSAEVAADLLNMANDMRMSSSIDQAEIPYTQAYKLRGKLSKLQRSYLADGLTALAEFNATRGKNDQSEALFKQAITLKTETDGDKSSALANIQEKFGLFQRKTTQYSRSEATLLDALATSQAASDKELTAKVLNDLGELYRDTKEFSKAAEMFKLAETTKNQ